MSWTSQISWCDHSTIFCYLTKPQCCSQIKTVAPVPVASGVWHLVWNVYTWLRWLTTCRLCIKGTQTYISHSLCCNFFHISYGPDHIYRALPLLIWHLFIFQSKKHAQTQALYPFWGSQGDRALPAKCPRGGSRYSKCGPWTSIISNVWDRVRNADAQAPLRTSECVPS